MQAGDIVIVYVDGENFVHQMVHTLRRAGHIKHSSDIQGIDLAGLCRHSLGTDDITIRYYTTKLKRAKADVYDDELEKTTHSLLEWNAMWTKALQGQGITIVKAGNLRLRDGHVCSQCGHQERFFQEKGVDVKLAVDLVLDAGEGVEQVIMSADSDLIPAVKAAKLHGSNLKNLVSEEAINMGLAYECGTWHRFKTSELVTAYNQTIKRGKHA